MSFDIGSVSDMIRFQFLFFFYFHGADEVCGFNNCRHNLDIFVNRLVARCTDYKETER